MSSLVKILLTILFFFLPLINSRLLNIFWIDLWFYVNWNYEFTKVMFFNIISWLIIVLSFLQYINNPKKIKINKNLLYIISFYLWVMILWSIFSLSPYNSIFGISNKAHSLIMFTNLIWLYIILINTKKSFLKKLIKISIFSCFLSIIIAIKELFLPSFDYSELSNRALGTFGHPNYLSLYILILIPSIYKIYFKKYKKKKLFIILLLFISLIFTKSFWAIILFIFYNLYYFKKDIFSNLKKDKVIIYIILILTIIISFLFLFPEKLHSFLSRFFIWWTTLNIIFSNPKILLLGWWYETLNLIFDNYKSSYLYIFENIGYSADRPHNLLLNIFYHNWILWLTIFTYVIFAFIKNYKNKYSFNWILLFLLFTLFNFASIASYTIIVLFFAIEKKTFKTKKIISKFFIPIFMIILTSISLLWILFSFRFYIAETYFYNNNYLKAKSLFPFNKTYYYELWEIKKGLKIEKFKSKQYLINQILTLKDIKNDCNNLVIYFPSAENYFYCWDILEEYLYKDTAKEYYELWLNKLPDLRNKNSKYYNNIFIKNFISWNRFFSTKYSNIKEILKKIKD